MFVYADRVKETTEVVGTSPYPVLLGSPLGYLTFYSAMEIGDTFHYCIDGGATGEWEIGIGECNNETSFYRKTPITSSVGWGERASFSAGTKAVFLTLTAQGLDEINSKPVVSASLTAESTILTVDSFDAEYMTAASSCSTLLLRARIRLGGSCTLKLLFNGSTTAADYRITKTVCVAGQAPVTTNETEINLMTTGFNVPFSTFYLDMHIGYDVYTAVLNATYYYEDGNTGTHYLVTIGGMFQRSDYARLNSISFVASGGYQMQSGSWAKLMKA